MEYVGTRWHKCDFHLHTFYSDCFKDKSVTPEQWIKEVKDKRLSCIAVTDHNDYRAIDSIKIVAEKEGILVFPGVELTCDTSKIHMLILFDNSKGGDKVRDFLNFVGIDSEEVGKSEGTELTVFDVCEKAKSKGAIVIAAHIDEYNGINSMSASNVKKILDRKYIDAVQVVNESIWEGFSKTKSKEEMLEALSKKYGKAIPFNEADSWRKTYNKVETSNIPMLNFSDNPCAEGEAKHGLWGIGRDYTWIKMDKNPNIESIRQAFLSDDMRVARGKSFVNCPEHIPDFWIHSISILDTTINPNKEINIQFNPQLNTIIGGRGSGKSSIIRILAGALKSADMGSLPSIANEQNNFYRKCDIKNKLGIFTNNSEVIIRLVRNQFQYKVHVSNINSMDNQDIKLFQLFEDGSEKEIENANYLDFFKIQVYTQKQIFELAKDANALMGIIDKGIDKMPDAIETRESAYSNLLSHLVKIRSVERVIQNEEKVSADLEDLENQIEAFKKSGISSAIEQKQSISDDEKSVNEYVDTLSQLVIAIDNLISEKKDLITECGIQDDELSKNINSIIAAVTTQIQGITNTTSQLMSLQTEMKSQLKSDYWIGKKSQVQQTYEAICKKLEEQDLERTKLDSLLVRQAEKKNELLLIQQKKQEMQQLSLTKTELEKTYNDAVDNVHKLRSEFIKSIIGENENIRIEIKKKKNKTLFDNMLHEVIQKNNATINMDIDALVDVAFGKEGLVSFRKVINNIRAGIDVKGYSTWLKKHIKEMSSEAIDKMLTYIPDDEVEVRYKPEGARSYLPLSSASAGQKTTAMLTFILAYGEIPLLLDQPEDDLDNRLVYELIVRRLKLSKAGRQLIIVTHNANIPVNGDAEYITSLNSDTRYVEVKAEGTLDNENVRKEICDVMEGTEHAFEMRAKKYHLKIVE